MTNYGANLASESLPGPGGGFRRIHNNIQSLVQSMMKVAGIQSVKEAVNFLLGNFGEPYINNYVDHLSSLKLVNVTLPLLLYTCGWIPGGYTKTVNDSGATQSGEIFAEVKTMQPNNTRYNQNNSTLRPADRRAKLILLMNINSSLENLIESMLLML